MEAALQSPFGQTVLEPGVVTIGSTPDSRLIVHDARVSPHHAVVRSTEQGYTITDWGSADGTFVNDQRLDPFVPSLLIAGDRIRIGETVFTYEVHEGAMLVAGKGSRREGEPAALAAPSEHTAYGAQAQLFSASPDQTQYGSAPPQRPDIPPGAPESIPAYGAPPPPPPYTPPLQQKEPPKGRSWRMPRKWRLFALIALIILLFGGSAPFLISWTVSVLPGATATVTMTPASQHLTKVSGIFAVTETPDASQNQIQARALAFTTKAQAKTVKATGQGHQEATVAKGQLRITPIRGTIPVGLEGVTSWSGVAIYYYVATPITSPTTVDAYAAKPGSAGNIAAYDVSADYPGLYDSTLFYYAENPQAFTGGQNAYDYTYVQQSDIDGATTPLVSQLTSDAQASVQQQVRANEQIASPPECTPNIKTNHKANDRVSDMTVTVTVTCKGEVYNEQAARSMAADLFTIGTASQLGDHYILVGDTVIGTPQVVMTYGGTVTLNVSAEGVWVYQFSESQKQRLAQLIAGKSLADAQALLLKQEGVWKATLTTDGGWGSALPTSPNDIKFNVLAVPGLQATP